MPLHVQSRLSVSSFWFNVLDFLLCYLGPKDGSKYIYTEQRYTNELIYALRKAGKLRLVVGLKMYGL